MNHVGCRLQCLATEQTTVLKEDAGAKRTASREEGAKQACAQIEAKARSLAPAHEKTDIVHATEKEIERSNPEMAAAGCCYEAGKKTQNSDTYILM